MQTITIYIDILLFVNLVVNGFIIYATGQITGAKISFIRFISADGIASLYGLAICIPELGFALNSLMKIGTGLLICFIAFGKRNLFSFFKNVSVFCAITFTYMALMVFLSILSCGSGIYMRNGEAYYNLPVPVILIFTLVLFVILGILRRFARAKIPDTLIYRCSAYVGQICESFDCYLDTGNFLCESITGTPVVIIDEYIAKSLVPDWDAATPEEMSDDLKSRFRLIPYKCAGGGCGLLPAFKPDEFIVENQEYKVIIAVNQTEFDADKQYHGILNRELLYGGLK